MDPSKKAADAAKTQACAMLRDAVAAALPPSCRDAEGDPPVVTVAELQCTEPGCAPVEVVFTVHTAPTPIMFKVFSAAVDATADGAVGALKAAMQQAGGAAVSAASLEGVYDFEHAGGVFDVHLRPGGRFFAPKYQAGGATWELGTADDGGRLLLIDWKKYGKYELKLDGGDARSLSGGAVGKPESWRKMRLKRPFSTAEANLLDSKWMFEHPSGKMEIEFRADGYNHFICRDFPAHSHWTLKGEVDRPVVHIAWGKYGNYELAIEPSGESMAGSAVGQPENWRKAVRIGALASGLADEHAHDH